MRIAATAVALAAAVVLAGCSGINPRSDLLYRSAVKEKVDVIPPQGILFSRIKAPAKIVPTSFGSRMGSATTRQIGLPPLPFPGLTTGLDLFAWGDASIQSAAAGAGITDVKHVDYESQVFLLFFRKFTIEVYGD